MELSKLEIIYNKGYRVTLDGKLINKLGKERKFHISKGQFYPTVSFRNGDKFITVRVHRFAAFCFYGDKVFDKKLQVRHLDANVMNISKANIVLGTKSENEQDKPKSVRLTALRKRNAVRKKIFTNQQVLDVIKHINSNTPISDIAYKFGVNRSTIYKIKNRKGIYARY